MKKVAQVDLSGNRRAKVYYGCQHESDGSILAIHIEAVADPPSPRLTPGDQLRLLEAARQAVERACASEVR